MDCGQLCFAGLEQAAQMPITFRIAEKRMRCCPLNPLPAPPGHGLVIVDGR